MIVDTHVHVWPPDVRPGPPLHHAGPATARELTAELDAAGVDAAVLVTPRALGTDNSYLLEAARNHPERCLSVIGLVGHRGPGAAERLRRAAADERLVGIRFHPCFEPELDLTEASLATFWETAAGLGLVVCLHVDPGQEGQVAWLAERYPALRQVVDHLGRARVGEGTRAPAWRTFLGLARFPNVHVKISSIPWLLRDGRGATEIEPFISAAVDAFGAERLVWGSDWPLIAGLGSLYAASLEPVRSGCAFLSEADRAAILGGTALRLFRPRGLRTPATA